MNREDVFQLIIRHVSEVLPELDNHSFQQTDRLLDLGANSVDRAEIIMMTLESLSLHIPRVDLSEARNIGELAEIIFQKLQVA